jgi:hypothetical protein
MFLLQFHKTIWTWTSHVVNQIIIYLKGYIFAYAIKTKEVVAAITTSFEDKTVRVSCFEHIRICFQIKTYTACYVTIG